MSSLPCAFERGSSQEWLQELWEQALKGSGSWLSSRPDYLGLCRPDALPSLFFVGTQSPALGLMPDQDS